jgi:5-methylcytosine-specific restriction endonuclease McrA
MTCPHCGDALPIGSQRNRVYCSKACSNAAYKAAGRGSTPERQREYARASYRRRRAALLAEVGERACPECGTPLPSETRLRRVYCSRRCINQVSLRERRAERQAATERRRLKLVGGEHIGVSERDWRRLVARHAGRCAYCGEVKPLTKDHIIPVSRGGRHAIGNILPACQSCNSSKRDALLINWRGRRTAARLGA